MQTNIVSNQNFGMAIKYKNYRAVQNHIFNTFSPKECQRFAALETAQKSNPNDVFLSIQKNRRGKNRLVAESGDKVFKESFLQGGLTTIEEAASDATRKLVNKFKKLLKNS